MNTEKLRRLLEDATPGPWVDALINVETDDEKVTVSYWGCEDSVLAVAAVNALPALLDRLDKLEAVAEAASKVNDYTRLTNSFTPICDNQEALQELEEALDKLDEGGEV